MELRTRNSVYARKSQFSEGKSKRKKQKTTNKQNNAAVHFRWSVLPRGGNENFGRVMFCFSGANYVSRERSSSGGLGFQGPEKMARYSWFPGMKNTKLRLQPRGLSRRWRGEWFPRELKRAQGKWLTQQFGAAMPGRMKE